MLKNFLISGKIIVFSFLFLLAGNLSVAHAQTALPAGGSSLETAVQSGVGEYQGQLAPATDFYYRIEVKPGQEITVKGGYGLLDGENSYSLGNLYLYDGNKEEWDYVYGAGGTLGPWLSNARQNVYIRMENEETETTLTYNLEITIQNRFDAASLTDAGDDFDGALTIVPGSYTGYLAGVSVMQTPYGDDFKDYYKVSLQKGINYDFKLTPSTGDEGQLALYDANRESLDETSSANAGAVASLSLTPSADTSVYLVVGCGYKGGIFNYKLEVKSPEVSIKFYTCKDNGCISAGNFSSLDACQKATTKTCYQASDCNGKCEGVKPACVKDSDCPADHPSCVSGKCVGGEKPPVGICQSECTVDQTKCFDNFNYYKCDDYNKDGCLEWSSPVYCGEGNKCDNGQCTKTEGCKCSEWQSTGCGLVGCSSGQIAKVRTCTPAACDLEKTCQDDASCQTIIPPITPSDTDWFGLIKGLGVWGWLGGLYLIFFALFYIYLAICLQVLAKKTGTANSWMAWVPIVDIFLMINIAQKPWWWFLLLLIPIVNIVIGIVLWMAIAERRGKENWFGILIIIPVVGIFIPGYLAFFDNKKSKKAEPTKPAYVPTGTQEADKPTVGYKHPCKYCGKLIPPDSAACPYCEKVNPLGPFRCPKCHEPIEKDWKACSKCNLNLRIVCPYCSKVTFFGDHCQDCGARLLVTCPSCGQEQPPLGDNCIKCDKPLQPKTK